MEPLHVPPSNGRPNFVRDPPPLLGRCMNLRPATKDAYPLGSPDDRLLAPSRGEPIVNICRLDHPFTIYFCLQFLKESIDERGASTEAVYPVGSVLAHFLNPCLCYGRRLPSASPRAHFLLSGSFSLFREVPRFKE